MYEILKELRIPFLHRWRVGRSEVDFLVGKFAIDLDGHAQDGDRNFDLIERGYVPIHFSNRQLLNRETIKLELIKLCHS